MAQDDTQADGYYAEDEIGKDEIDLSFLNEEPSDKTDKTNKKDPEGESKDD